VVIRGGARAHIDGDRPVVLERPQGLRSALDLGLFAHLEPALFCVDGNNLLWRAAHGHPAPFTASDGRDITPPFRFFSMLRRALGSYGLFAECVVCFDGAAAWAGRLDIDRTYKANRQYSGVDLSFMEWLPEIRAALASAGILSIEIEDQEADDVIATLAAGARGRRVRILSTDRDYFQLLSPTVTVVNPRSQPSMVESHRLTERYGVGSHQWCDFRALAGDPSDGIPGLKGVGPKRAAEILAGGATLEELEAAGRLDPLVAEHWSDVCRWRELIRLRTDVRLDFEPVGVASPKAPSPVAVCRELGLIGA
jgi:DNA polymerase-1